MNNSLEWRRIYTFIEEGDFTKDYESDADDLVDVKGSKLHKIATRPTIVPYYDMVWWIISHIDISTCTIFNSSHQVVSSFKPDDVSNMYKLIPPTVRLDEVSLENSLRKMLKKRK
jgi:hypothetical protein